MEMLDVVLSAMLGAYRHAPRPARRPGRASCGRLLPIPGRTGPRLARKCPTLMHSVRPIRTRRASGWCTWPNRAYRGWVRRMWSRMAVLPRSSRRATGVVQQLRHGRRDVRATARRPRRWRSPWPRRRPRRSRRGSGRRKAAAADEPERVHPPSVARCPSRTSCPGFRCCCHSGGMSTFAVGHVGGLGHGREQLRVPVLLEAACCTCPDGSPSSWPHSRRGELPGLVEPLGQAQARRTSASPRYRTVRGRCPAGGRRSR